MKFYLVIRSVTISRALAIPNMVLSLGTSHFRFGFFPHERDSARPATPHSEADYCLTCWTCLTLISSLSRLFWIFFFDVSLSVGFFLSLALTVFLHLNYQSWRTTYDLHIVSKCLVLYLILLCEFKSSVALFVNCLGSDWHAHRIIHIHLVISLLTITTFDVLIK